jgi:anti-sigma B factor antagonist
MQTDTRVTVDRAQSSPVTILRFSGDISSASREALLGTYSKLPAADNKQIILDFSKVEYLNSSGIALVIQVLIDAGKAGQKIHISGLTPHFQKVFTMVGITRYAPLFVDEAAAEAAFQG